MTASSQPTKSSESLSDFSFVAQEISNVTIDLSTITTASLTNGSVYYDPAAVNSYLYTTTTGSVSGLYNVSDTISISNTYEFNWGSAKEFVDAFPGWQRVQDMCKKYPGLEIALRNFQTVYTLVKDDYDTSKDEG